MSIKKLAVTISILAMLVIALFIYPSLNQSVNAEQSSSTAAGLENAYCITTESNAVLNHYFGETIVEKTLQQPGCAGVRMYYGKQKDGSPKLQIIGVDKNGKNLTPSILAGSPKPCPPNCGA